MFHEYLRYFLTGTSNTALSKDFAADFAINSKDKLSKAQQDFIYSQVRVERNVNLFFALVADTFLILGFFYGFNQIIINVEGDPSSALMLSIGSFIFVQIIILAGIFFKLIFPYLKHRIYKIYRAEGMVEKKVLDFDTALIHQIKVANDKFLVDKSLYDSLEQGRIYRVHYVRTPRVNLIVSMR